LAIDNSLYDSLENTYFKIKDYFDNNKLGPEHSQMIIKHEELAELLERLDIEAIEELSNNIHALHDELNKIKEVSNKIVEDMNATTDSNVTATNVVSGLEKIFLQTSNVIV
jgi:uncharacterized coiled-coil DUF342 family protein